VSETNDISMMLGEIRGELKGINKRLDKVDSMDKRLRSVERKSAVNGAISGGAVSVGLFIISESVKAAFKTHGS